MQSDKRQDDDLSNYGYEKELRRAIGGYTSFALSFSMVPIQARKQTVVRPPAGFSEGMTA